jgi:hypothetical protein
MEKRIKRFYFESLARRYARSSKKVKGEILNDICTAEKCHRKHAIRLLKGVSTKRDCQSGKPRGRPSKYDNPDFCKVLRQLWKATQWMGSKALKASIPEWLPFYERHHGDVGEATRQQLTKISAATIDRILKPIKASGGKGRCGTKPGTLLRNEIPIRAGVWDSTVPGFVEADTVAHCGTSLMGDFIWSLTITDIATTWTEMRALWGKGSSGVLSQIEDIEAHMPFELRGFDCDNGSEFLNNHLLRYFTEKPQTRSGVFQFTRSRPYHKGDNAHVEQKNYTHARQVLGYERLDFIELVAPINAMYSHELSLLRNHFYPSFKLKHKLLIKSRHRRVYDKPVTPYARVQLSAHVLKENKERLEALHRTLDPIKLQQSLTRKQKELQNLIRMLKDSQHLTKKKII